MQSVFEAMADSRRRRMIEWVKSRPQIETGCLSAHFDLSRSAVSRHLDILASAGVLTRRRDGRRVRLSVDLAPLRKIRDGWFDRVLGRTDDDSTRPVASPAVVTFVHDITPRSWRRCLRLAASGTVLASSRKACRLFSVAEGGGRDGVPGTGDAKPPGPSLRLVVILPDGKTHDAEISSEAVAPSVVRVEWKNVSPVRWADRHRLNEVAAWWLSELSAAARGR